MIKLNLNSTFNCIEYDKLLQIIILLRITAYFIEFHKGFLNNRRFRVKCNNMFYQLPQGTVSSLQLFLIFMKALLCKIYLFCLCNNINFRMFADNLLAFALGKIYLMSKII